MFDHMEKYHPTELLCVGCVFPRASLANFVSGNPRDWFTPAFQACPLCRKGVCFQPPGFLDWFATNIHRSVNGAMQHTFARYFAAGAASLGLHVYMHEPLAVNRCCQETVALLRGMLPHCLQQLLDSRPSVGHAFHVPLNTFLDDIMPNMRAWHIAQKIDEAEFDRVCDAHEVTDRAKCRQALEQCLQPEFVTPNHFVMLLGDHCVMPPVNTLHEINGASHTLMVIAECGCMPHTHHVCVGLRLAPW